VETWFEAKLNRRIAMLANHLPALFKTVFGSRSRKAGHKRPQRNSANARRLTLESLEARELLSVSPNIEPLPVNAVNRNLCAAPLATSAVPDGAGNTLATARNVGALSSTQTFQDFVGQADTNDYNKFSVAKRGTVTMAVSGLAADADVQLLNSAGTTVVEGLGELLRAARSHAAFRS
jgi:hypothetical protein